MGLLSRIRQDYFPVFSADNLKMKKTSANILAENIEKLMQHSIYNSNEKLGKAAKIDPKTISNMRNPDRFSVGPTTSKIDAVANVFNLESWQLLFPGLSIESIDRDAMNKLLPAYAAADEGGKQTLLRIAEQEMKYNVSKNTTKTDN